MTSLTVWIRAGLLLILLGTGRALAAADPNLLPGADEKWRRYESPHFELYSRASEADSRLLLNNLELVQAICFETFAFKPVRAMPITVFLFSRDKFFTAYKPEAFRKAEDIAAFHYGGTTRSFMIIAPLPTFEAAQQLAFSSYTHHMFNLVGDEPPLWFNYGLAGIMRNIELFYEEFSIGKAKPEQVERLQRAKLIPVEVLLAADQQSAAFRDNVGNSLIHDESWALVHYLYFGKHNVPPARVHQFVEFCLAQSRKYDPAATAQALAAQLGMDFKQLDSALQSYFRGGRYGWARKKSPVVPPAKTYASRAVPLAEINLRLAELALRVDGSPRGKLTLLQAAGKTSDEARILEALATDAMREGDRDRMHERLVQAVEAGSLNPAVFRRLLEHEDLVRFNRFDAFYRMPDAMADQLRGWIARFQELSPRDPLSWEVLAWVEATSAQPRIASLNAVQREFAGLTRKSRTLLALAWAHHRLNDSAGAEQMLRAIEESEISADIAWTIEIIRSQIENRQPRRELRPGARDRDGFIRSQIQAPRPKS